MKKKLTPVTLTFDQLTPKSIGFLMTDLWTKFEEGSSKRSRSETKRLQTDGPTDMCKAICPLFFQVGA